MLLSVDVLKKLRVTVNLVSPIYSCYFKTPRIKCLDGLCIFGIETLLCFDAKSNCRELAKEGEVIKVNSNLGLNICAPSI